jgi:AraC-like DNA-binding protein
MRRTMSVGFSLGGAAAMLGTPLSEVAGQLVDIEDLWGRNGAVVRERLLEQPTPAHKLEVLHDVLARQADGWREPDGAVRHAAVLLRHGHPVRATAEAVGLSHRSLARRVKRETGLAPKQYARGARLNRLIDYVNDRDPVGWTEAASAVGYYDQSHLIHDFRDLTGITPNEYQPRQSDTPRHVAMPASRTPPTVRGADPATCRVAP